MVEKELTRGEKSIYNRLNLLFREMALNNLCIFVNDGTLEVYRGGNAPHLPDGRVDNTKSIMAFCGPSFCTFDGGATL